MDGLIAVQRIPPSVATYATVSSVCIHIGAVAGGGVELSFEREISCLWLGCGCAGTVLGGLARSTTSGRLWDLVWGERV